MQQFGHRLLPENGQIKNRLIDGCIPAHHGADGRGEQSPGTVKCHMPFVISKHLAQRTTHLQYQSTLRSVEGYLSVYVYLTHTTYMPQYSSHLAQPHDPFAAKFVGIVLNQTSVHACIDVGHVHEAADKYIGARAYTHARAHTERKRQLKVRTAQRRRKEERDTVGQIAAREAPFQCPHTGTAGKGLTSHIGRIPSRKI